MTIDNKFQISDMVSYNVGDYELLGLVVDVHDGGISIQWCNGDLGNEDYNYSWKRAIDFLRKLEIVGR